MRRACLSACVVVVQIGGSASAAPIPDTTPWAQSFTKAALANDPEAMLARVQEIAHPGFKIEALRGVFGKIDAVVGTQPGDYAEQFGEQNVGTFLKRINIAVHYLKTYLYYTIAFTRDPAGWQMTEIDYNTNINDVLTMKWPA